MCVRAFKCSMATMCKRTTVKIRATTVIAESKKTLDAARAPRSTISRRADAKRAADDAGSRIAQTRRSIARARARARAGPRTRARARLFATAVVAVLFPLAVSVFGAVLVAVAVAVARARAALDGDLWLFRPDTVRSPAGEDAGVVVVVAHVAVAFCCLKEPGSHKRCSKTSFCSAA